MSETTITGWLVNRAVYARDLAAGAIMAKAREAFGRVGEVRECLARCRLTGTAVGALEVSPSDPRTEFRSALPQA